MEFRLDHDFGWDDGLICGGIMEIYIHSIDRSRADGYRELLAAVKENRTGLLKIDYEQSGACKHYIEELGPPPTLIIAGAGHVGQALGEIAAKLDFRVTVIDDREDYASVERFPNATKRIVGDIEQNLRDSDIDASTYVVIVTRGHRHDGDALRAVINSPAKYLGLIGSKAKIKLIFEDLVASGIEAEKLMRVHAPIGYEIGAVTVPEIAVSIAAELIAVRRGRDGQIAKPMKMDAAQMKQWLSRSSERVPQ
jgi:xanthine dehydrogenase accessory factor